MIPLFWNWWSPQLHFPLSGSVTQDFFRSIRPEAGTAHLEKQIFDIASYGKQLGWITEVLLAQAQSGAVDRVEADKALSKLEQLYRDVEAVKAVQQRRLCDAAREILDQLRDRDPDELQRVLQRYSSGTSLELRR